jgi:hypothetical protein
MLVEALETVLSFERSGLVAVRFRASPNLGRVFSSAWLMIVEKSKTGERRAILGLNGAHILCTGKSFAYRFSNVGIETW